MPCKKPRRTARIISLTFLLLLTAAGTARAGGDREVTLLADLPLEVEAALAGDAEGDPLDAVFEAGKPYRFEQGPLVALTDRRWFASRL